ncbi:MAG: hypothetical protein LBT01_07705 [Spirochaetaceae bacterium]|jgi:hypothetical protein|nr:hypothetical protein [Spirochaetaceae bacterium]
MKLPDTDTLSALLQRKTYLAETLEKDPELSSTKRKHLCAELDALTRTLSFTRLILEKLPPEQFCKIITKYDEINGIPPSPPESVLQRIDHARETMRMSNEE